MVLSGPSGRAAYAHIDEQASGLFVFHHPTLGDWSAVPAQFKRADGGVSHAFAGVTPDDGGTQDEAGDHYTAAEKFAGRGVVELFVLGHVTAFANGRRSDGKPFAAMKLGDATLLDSITAAAVPYRSDTGTWAQVDDKYKTDSGGPRVDPDAVTETDIIEPG